MPTHGHGHEMLKVLAHVYNNNLGDGRALRYIFPLPNVIGKDAASIPVAADAQYRGDETKPPILFVLRYVLKRLLHFVTLSFSDNALKPFTKLLLTDGKEFIKGCLQCIYCCL